MKKQAKADKKKVAEDLAEEAEEAARRGDMNRVHKISKQLSGKSGKSAPPPPPVKNKDGKVITTEKEQSERWRQHSQEVLNRPEPEEPAEPTPSEITLDIDTGPPTAGEVKDAILAMKSKKAPGIDMIQAEMLKADRQLSSSVLTEFFRKVWEGEEIPEDWSEGIIVKLPKKGD